MKSIDLLLTQLQETGRITLHGVTTLSEIISVCDTLGLAPHEILVDGRENSLNLFVKEEDGT